MSKVTLTVPAKASNRIGKRRRSPRLVAGYQNPADYRQLLMDPCRGPLVHPPVDGGDTGYLMRVRKVIYAPPASALTAGFLYYHPALQQAYLCSVTDGNTATPQTISPSSASNTNIQSIPTAGALFNWSSGLRPVASCVDLQYAGQESSRQGIVSFGNQVSVDTMGDFISSAFTIISDWEARLPEALRSPVDKLTVRYKPDRAAMLFGTNISNITNYSSLNPRQFNVGDASTNGILYTWSGLANPASLLRFEITTVYEWKPSGTSSGASGIVQEESRGRYAPGVNMDYILNTIKETDWAYWGSKATDMMTMMANMRISGTQYRRAGVSGFLGGPSR